MSTTSTQVKRTVSMSEKTNADLVRLCEALGLNVHSYMINELSKAIQRDSIALVAQNQQADLMKEVLKIIAENSTKG